MRRSTLLLLILLLLGCTSWQPVAPPTPVDHGWEAHGKLRITALQGYRFRGDSAWLSSDTIRLRVRGDSTAVLARHAVGSIERHGFDKGKTGALVLGSLFLGLIMSLATEDLFSGWGGTTIY